MNVVVLVGTRFYENDGRMIGWHVFKNGAGEYMVFDYACESGLSELYENEDAAWDAALAYSQKYWDSLLKGMS